jgi:hypothetical protein
VLTAFSWARAPPTPSRPAACSTHESVTVWRVERYDMNNVIYIVGLVVVVIAVLSFFGLR